MNSRAFRKFLIAVGIIVAVAVVLHLFAGGAMRALGQAIHGQ